jgi:HAD superfamily hydrolase (TIGR01509 family)
VYSGIIFDFDGVLYDSEKHWEKIENRYLIERVPGWDPYEYKHLIGHSLPEAYTYLKNRGLRLTEEQYFADYHKMAMELYANYAKPLLNIDTLLRRLSIRKTKMAVASSSKRIWIDTALHNSALPIDFTVIVSSDDKSIAKGKPAPDVYLRAAELLGEQTSKLIAIEDSKNGVVSAKAAGLYCFGLRNGFNETQDLSEADDIIHGYTPQNMKKILNLII